MGEPPSSGPFPERIGDFLLIREIGRGATGNVYEAEQTSMRRRVALKILHPATTLNPRAVARFRREAQTAGKLHHTHIVPVYTMGTDRGLSWFAMELVDGQPLSHVIADLRRLAGTGRGASGVQPPTSQATDGSTGFGSSSGSREFYVRVARAFAGAADALAAAHAAGVIHRDVKPSNLLLAADGTIQLLDFGLARAQEDGTPALTMTGDVVGTPSYMSPEQVRGGSVDARTDVYGLGATLYEVLTLAPPFQGSDVAACLAKITTREPLAPRRRNPRIPRDLETIVLKAMEKEAGKRYATAGHLERDLRAFADGTGIAARRVGRVRRALRAMRRHPGRAAVAAALPLLVAAVLWFAASGAREHDRRIDAEFQGHMARAGQLMAASIRRVGSWGDVNIVTPRREQAAIEELRLAADLAPERPEVGRALAALHSDAAAPFLRQLGPGERRSWELARDPLSGLSPREARQRVVAVLAETPSASPLERLLEARARVRIGDLPGALAPLDLLLRGPDTESCLAALGLALRSFVRDKTGDLPGAIQDLAALRGLSRESDPVRELAEASLWRKAGRREEAERAFTRILKACRARGGEQVWLDAFWGADPSLNNDWLLAIAREAHERYPASAALTVCYATAVMQGLDDRAEALKLARAAVALAPDDVAVRTFLAESLFNAGSNAEAEAECRRVLASDPGNGGARQTLVQALAVGGKVKEAVDEGSRWTAASHLEHQAWCASAYALLAASDYPRALTAVDEAIGLDSGCWWSTWLRIRVLQPLERYEEVLASIDGLPSGFAHVDRMAMDRGQTLFRLGRLTEAVTQARSLVAAKPTDVKYRMNLASSLLQTGDLPGAIAQFDEHLRLQPGDALARVGRAVALAASGSSKDALEEFSKVTPGEGAAMPPWVGRGYARFLRSLGRLEEARGVLPGEQPGPIRDPFDRRRSERFRYLLVADLGRKEDLLEDARRLGVAAPPRLLAPLVLCLRKEGRLDEARDWARRYAAVSVPRDERVDEAYLHAVAGRIAQAHASIEGSGPEWVADEAWRRGCVHALLGEAAAALDWLSVAADRGHKQPPLGAWDVELTALRDDPRYQAVREKMTLR